MNLQTKVSIAALSSVMVASYGVAAYYLRNVNIFESKKEKIKIPKIQRIPDNSKNLNHLFPVRQSILETNEYTKYLEKTTSFGYQGRMYLLGFVNPGGGISNWEKFRRSELEKINSSEFKNFFESSKTRGPDQLMKACSQFYEVVYDSSNTKLSTDIGTFCTKN